MSGSEGYPMQLRRRRSALEDISNKSDQKSPDEADVPVKAKRAVSQSEEQFGV